MRLRLFELHQLKQAPLPPPQLVTSHQINSHFRYMHQL